jgi:hypothetical protein
MAILETSQYAAQNAVGSTRRHVNVNDAGAKLRYFECDITFTGAPAVSDEINFVRLPARHKIVLFQSFYKSSASWGAGAQMDIGYRAYTKEDGTTQAEENNAIIDNLDMTITARTAIVTPLGTKADVMAQVETLGRDSVVVYGTVRVDAPAAADTLKILFAVLTD